MSGDGSRVAGDVALRLADGWMAAAADGQLVFVGPDRVIDVAVEGAARVDDALAALSGSLDLDALGRALDATPADVAELLALLTGAGVLGPADGRSDLPHDVIPLAAALASSLRGEPLTGDGRTIVVTADEALVLPPASTLDQERRALHAFVAGLTPDARLHAYCRMAAEGHAASVGDRPPAELLAARIGSAEPGGDEVQAIALADGATDVVARDALGEIGCGRAHRLGPLEHVGPLERPESANEQMHVYVARYAVANLRFPEKADARLGGGRAPSPELAELIARAEAAERYGSGDLARHELVRSAESELDAPFVTPDRLYRGNDRQRAKPSDLVPYDPAGRHLWIAGATPSGERRWLPADAVFYPFYDPQLGGRTLATSSSGSAAHSTLAEARTRAICELVERDAFMWTWIQRVERESIDTRSIPRPLRDRLPHIRSSGREIGFVNLTLDLLPVVACLIYSRDRLSLAMACSPDPAEAAERSLNEAVGLMEVMDRGRLVRVEPEQVRTPEQHAALYMDPERVERNRFLLGSSDRVALDEIARSDASVDELVAQVAEVVTVDLGTPATAPFALARVVIPDLVPMSFGYDREPLGMARLAEPKRTHDGRTLGAVLDLADVGPLDPHPFA